MKNFLVLVVLVMGFSAVAFAHAGHDYDEIENIENSEGYKTAYFGEESDYLDYISNDVAVRQGVHVGWWYPTYNEFLGN